MKFTTKHKKIIHHFTKKDWDNKVKETKGFCPECGNFVGIKKLTIDHIYPISKAPAGTVYGINDVQAICRSCNSSKADKIIKITENVKSVQTILKY